MSSTLNYAAILILCVAAIQAVSIHELPSTDLGWLGKSVRIVLPSCAVHKIRHTFPSEVYAGFKYPQL